VTVILVGIYIFVDGLHSYFWIVYIKLAFLILGYHLSILIIGLPQLLTLLLIGVWPTLLTLLALLTILATLFRLD
jgi:hypothetical protein